MSRQKKMVSIIRQEKIADDVYSMWLKAEDMAHEAKPGQFVTLYSKNGARLLPRPISICEIHKEVGTLRIVYRLAGEGTKEFSNYHAENEIDVLGPLGTGFPVHEAVGKKVLIVGGGIGIPPLLELAKTIKEEKQIVLGYRDMFTFLKEEMEENGKVSIATEDGSIGTKGTVLDAIRENEIEADVIFACGPTPMLKALKEYAAKKDIPAWISLEEHMACGIGACLACVCDTVEKDEHSQVNHRRVCKDGPVFLASEVEL